MTYELNGIYYIALGRQDANAINPFAKIGIGRLNCIEHNLDPKREKYHFNDVVTFKSGVKYHNYCVGKDCLDAVNKEPISSDDMRWYGSHKEEISKMNKEYSNVTTAPKVETPLDLTAKIHNLIIDYIKPYKEEIAKLKNENKELKSRFEAIRSALGLENK